MPNQPSKSTVAGHQGTWVPFGKSMVCDPVWSDKKVPANAWRVWWWMNNSMTGTVMIEDEPKVYGVVKGGTPISFMAIAEDLNCSWSSVRRATEWLVDHGMLSRGRFGKGQMYVYNVLQSIRLFDIRTLEKNTSFDIEDDDDGSTHATPTYHTGE